MPDYVSLIYFSPTGTTRTTVTAIAKGLAAQNTEHVDLTLQPQGPELTLSEGLAVFAVPVYGGRVPQVCLERMAQIRGKQTPAALVALYGNREFEDALVELEDVVSANGFNVIAAAAFIGEHSYTTQEYPIAVGRPDLHDQELACAFGQQVTAKLTRADLSKPQIPGHRPYRQRSPLGGLAPETLTATCTLCGKCQQNCPTQVISLADKVVTQADNCIMCCACIKSCPTQARIFTGQVISERRNMLLNNCSTPKQPQLFL